MKLRCFLTGHQWHQIATQKNDDEDTEYIQKAKIYFVCLNCKATMTRSITFTYEEMENK